MPCSGRPCHLLCQLLACLGFVLIDALQCKHESLRWAAVQACKLKHTRVHAHMRSRWQQCHSCISLLPSGNACLHAGACAHKQRICCALLGSTSPCLLSMIVCHKCCKPIPTECNNFARALQISIGVGTLAGAICPCLYQIPASARCPDNSQAQFHVSSRIAI